jgi:glutaredoxin
MIRNLTEDECRYAIDNGDFAESLVKGKAAVIILTQSWCPQWIAVKSYLKEAEKKAAEKIGTDINIYTIEYDIAEWRQLGHEDFMTFKEDIFKNREIPYIRYYKDGVFSRDSNYLSLDGFLSRLQ